MSAGTGIWHSEMNPSSTEDVHFVQMWVLPDTERVDPGYEQLDINSELDRGGLKAIASGRGHDAAISIRQKRRGALGRAAAGGRGRGRAGRAPRPPLRRQRPSRARRRRRARPRATRRASSVRARPGSPPAPKAPRS